MGKGSLEMLTAITTRYKLHITPAPCVTFDTYAGHSFKIIPMSSATAPGVTVGVAI